MTDTMERTELLPADVEAAFDSFTSDSPDSLTEEQIEAILDSEFAEDYADEIFLADLELDPDRDPFGWDIADYIDWESMDYEGDVD